MTRELLTLLAAYALGSVPFSFLVARLWGIEDVRKVGSGNVGATNVMRSAGALPGLLAFALDAGKGAAAVALAQRFDRSGLLAALAAAGVVVGHVFPVWLGFRCGKGAATGAGAFAPVAPSASLAAVLTFCAVLALTRYVSVGSILGAAALSATLFVLDAPPPVTRAGVLLALLVVFRHKDNIRRLREGKERRIGGKA